MTRLEFSRPQSLASALAIYAAGSQAESALPEGGDMWLAGGQSLLAAMKLGMVSPARLIDLQDVPDLRDIRLETTGSTAASLWLGAMVTHARVARSGEVRRHSPGLAALAGGIADAQVREMGTLGGSLAHNDPAACWPAGVLSSGATIVTSRREITADEYFQGLYSTALEPGELIVGVRFPRLLRLHYLKFEQPASRFALVGVAVAQLDDPGKTVRVAVTGLGQGVQRWHAAEKALGSGLSIAALEARGQIALAELESLGDLHASAEYRQHLALVLARRCVYALDGGSSPQPLVKKASADTPRAAERATADAARRDGFGGVQQLSASPEQVWQTLLDPRRMKICIPGCESLVQESADAYEATVKVGLGPLSVRFKTEVLLRDQRPPNALILIFKGNAGALGSGQGTAEVSLAPLANGATQLDWWVKVQLGGRLAQFGNRLVEATARKLSGEFFERIGQALVADEIPTRHAASSPWWHRLFKFFFPSPRK